MTSSDHPSCWTIMKLEDRERKRERERERERERMAAHKNKTNEMMRG